MCKSPKFSCHEIFLSYSILDYCRCKVGVAGAGFFKTSLLGQSLHPARHEFWTFPNQWVPFLSIQTTQQWNINKHLLKRNHFHWEADVKSRWVQFVTSSHIFSSLGNSINSGLMMQLKCNRHLKCFSIIFEVILVWLMSAFPEFLAFMNLLPHAGWDTLKLLYSWNMPCNFSNYYFLNHQILQKSPQFSTKNHWKSLKVEEKPLA